MNLYLISQSENDGYDTYDSAVVAAESEEEAVQIHPGPSPKWGQGYSNWASSPEKVKCELIGVAIEGTEAGELLSSFNAG